MSDQHLARLRAHREAVHKDATAILDTAEARGSDLTAAETRRFEELSSDLDGLDAAISTAIDNELRTRETEAAFARLGGGGIGAAAPRLLPTLEEARALSSATAGIPTKYSNLWWDRLRAESCALSIGAQRVEVEGESLKVPTITGSATIGTYAENTAITVSDPTTAYVTVNPRLFGGLVKLSRASVEDSSSSILKAVELDLVRSMATDIDRAFIAGTGTNDVTGLLSVAGTTSGAATGANGSALTYGILADTVAAYEATGARLENAVWIVAPRTLGSVRKLVDSQARPLFVDTAASADAKRQLFGIDVAVSGAVPIAQTVGSSNDCSTLFLLDRTRMITGVSRDVEVRYSEDAGFAEDQIWAKVTARFDFVPSHAASVVKTVGVRP